MYLLHLHSLVALQLYNTDFEGLFNTLTSIDYYLSIIHGRRLLFCTKGVLFPTDESTCRVGFKFQFLSMGIWLDLEWTPQGATLYHVHLMNYCSEEGNFTHVLRVQLI